AIRNYVKEQGFMLAGSTDHDYRKTWMAERSTIYYYSGKSKFVAENMASDLKKLTGISFDVQMKKDPGLRKGQEDYFFIIHYIN
ncbi:MAG: hypothetical protein KDD04_04755, partial [Sinomicrobium sp.]|nr:hypothetical protein [Sinomicrobium sp.]